MRTAIAFTLSHLPIILFASAVLAAVLQRDGRKVASRLLDWLLLLAVGVQSLWAGLFHVFAPHLAAASIGWQVSPFQFEVGIADIAVGCVAIAAFRLGHTFKGAVVAYITIFYAGVAIGHVQQAISASDFAPNNFGPLLAMTVVKAFLLPILLVNAEQGTRLQKAAR